MTQSTILTLAMAGAIWLTLTGVCNAQAGGPSEPTSATPNYDVRALSTSMDSLVKEVMALKEELRKLKTEQHRSRIVSLERELERAKAKRLQIETQASLIQQDVHELDESLRQPLDSESYAKLLESRANIASGLGTVLKREQRTAAQREEEASKLLDSERRQLEVLLR
jgi:hypothetical protein